MLKKLTYFIVAVFLPCCLWGQAPQELVSLLESCPEDSCMRVEYAITALQGEDKISDTGYVEIQDGLWMLKGQGLEMYMDAKGTWIADPASKEVLIEPAWTYADLENFYKTFLSRGGRMELKVISRNCFPKKPLSCFTPSFGSAWIITDLR